LGFNRDILTIGLWRLISALAICVLCVGQNERALAQTLSSGMLSEALESRADDILARYLPKDQFVVNVTATPSNTASVRIPYLASAPNSDFLRTASISDLMKLTSSVKIELMIGSAVSPVNRESLVKIFTASMRLRPPPVDQVLVSQMNLASASATGLRDDGQVNKLLDDLRASNAQKETMAKERGDLKTELVSAKSEISRLSQSFNQQKDALSRERGDLKTELTTARLEISRLSQSLNQKSAELMSYLSGSGKANGQKESIAAVLKNNAPHLVLGLLIFAALTLIAAAFRQSGGKLSGSISEIATSLEEGIRSLGTSSNRGDNVAKAESLRAAPAPNQSMDAGASSVYQLKRLEELKTILRTSVTAESESQLTRWLSNIATDQARIPKAVVVLELLQADVASAIFRKLGASEQNAIVKFMRGGEFPRPKMDLMIEAGEEMLTRILADSLVGSKLSLKSDVSERILQLSTSDLANVFIELRPESHARLLLYMDTKTINTVMKQLRRQNQSTYKALVTQLSRVPAAERNTEADRDIATVLDRAITKVKDDSFRSYMNFFQEIVEQSDDDQKDDILSGIEVTNPDVADKLRRQVISFSSLFRLPQGLQNEIIASMSNRDIASLMIGLSNEDATNVLGRVSTRRKQIILDELKVLQEGDQENIRSSHKKSKDSIVQKIRAAGVDFTGESAA
jgi:Mg/Co/Ni transporter MgtE